MKKRFFVVCVGVALAVSSIYAVAQATTIRTETKIIHKPILGPVIVNYQAFDLNHDGLLSMEEVGEKLFYTFDKDGNELIDNIEFTNPMVLTFAPMERQTLQFIDYNSDGLTDYSTVTRETFLQQSGLSRFDEDANGLSAADFIEKPMKKIDRDQSGQIDIREWKEAYNAIARPMPQNDSFRYND